MFKLFKMFLSNDAFDFSIVNSDIRCVCSTDTFPN